MRGNAQLVAHITADTYSSSVPVCSFQSIKCFTCECREFGRVAEPDARLGLVAMQLGQVEEAKKLFTCAGRPDLLNKLLQVRVC
jgi:hypothetical protein